MERFLDMLIKGDFKNHTKLMNETESHCILWSKFNKEAFGVACNVGSAMQIMQSLHYHLEKTLTTELNICLNLQPMISLSYIILINSQFTYM